MKYTTLDQEQPAELRTHHSSNVVEGDVCFRDGESGQGFGPVFRCDSCGCKFCPVCTPGVWHTGRVDSHRYVWYCCPRCPIGLAFIEIPLAESVRSAGGQKRALWHVRVVADPRLQETRPGAYRVLFPLVKRFGAYQAYRDGTGPCLFQLGQEWLVWVQEAASALLVDPSEVSTAALLPIAKGEYLIAELTRDANPLLLFLQMPGGYQEYELPEGWPGRGTPRTLRITDRLWEEDMLLSLLPAPSWEKWETAAVEGACGGPVATRARRVA